MLDIIQRYALQQDAAANPVPTNIVSRANTSVAQPPIWPNMSQKPRWVCIGGRARSRNRRPLIPPARSAPGRHRRILSFISSACPVFRGLPRTSTYSRPNLDAAV
ncbi:hypothetical protein M8494_22540 [Serratia ureilytica]